MSNLDGIIAAAKEMDWEQVVFNGGPPCFHIEDNGHFCGRAERWDGHECIHKFVSFSDLLKSVIEITIKESKDCIEVFKSIEHNLTSESLTRKFLSTNEE